MTSLYVHLEREPWNCSKYVFYLTFQDRKQMNILSFKLYEYIYGFESLADHLRRCTVEDDDGCIPPNNSYKLDAVSYGYRLMRQISLGLISFGMPDTIIDIFMTFVNCDFVPVVEFITHSLYLNNIRKEKFDSRTPLGQALLSYCYVPEYAQNNVQIVCDLLPEYDEKMDLMHCLSVHPNNGLIVQQLCELAIAYHADTAYIYILCSYEHNVPEIDAIFDYVFGEEWQKTTLEFTYFSLLKKTGALPTLPPNFKDMIIVNNTRSFSKELDFWINMTFGDQTSGIHAHNLFEMRKLLESWDFDDEKYLLSSEFGSEKWSFCQKFVKEKPSFVYEIAKEHSKVLEKYENYAKYEEHFGSGSFYEDIIELANSSGLFVKSLYDKINGKPKAVLCESRIKDDFDFDNYNASDDEKYLLCSELGREMWELCGDFVKENPFVVYEIGKKYSKMLRICDNYLRYWNYFGSGSFYEDIIELAHSSGQFVKSLYYKAKRKTLLHEPPSMRDFFFTL